MNHQQQYKTCDGHVEGWKIAHVVFGNESETRLDSAYVLVHFIIQSMVGNDVARNFVRNEK
jgi:hypothetical protein